MQRIFSFWVPKIFDHTGAPMSCCDYCFVVHNPEHYVSPTKTGYGFPSTLFFFDPWGCPFTFGANQLDKDHLHVHMPTKATSSFIGKNGEFLVNSDKSFLIFSPLKQQLTYEEVLYPSDETHKLIVPVSNTIHKIGPGSVIVGIDYNRPNLFVCFAYFMNGAQSKLAMPFVDLMLNSTRVIYYIKQIKEAVQKKISNPLEKIAFKSELLKFSGEKLKGSMPPVSSIFQMKAASAGGFPVQTLDGGCAPVSKEDAKRTAEQDGVPVAKRTKANGK